MRFSVRDAKRFSARHLGTWSSLKLKLLGGFRFLRWTGCSALNGLTVHDRIADKWSAISLHGFVVRMPSPPLSFRRQGVMGLHGAGEV